MQALSLLALLASALGAASQPVDARDAADQLARFDSYPDEACSERARRGTARMLRSEDNACRTLTAELALGAKAVRIVPTGDDEAAEDRTWTVEVFIEPFCMGDPVNVATDDVCVLAPAPGIHWMSYKLRLS